MGLSQDSAAPNETPRFGPYRVVRPLGRGGMGVVYRAHHADTGGEVALKTVRLRDDLLLSAIRREIHALRRIDHPGVVRIVDEGVTDGCPWYAMELLHGQTLRSFTAGPWPEASKSTPARIAQGELGATRALTPSTNVELSASPVYLQPGDIGIESIDLSVMGPTIAQPVTATTDVLSSEKTKSQPPPTAAPTPEMRRRALARAIPLCSVLNFIHGEGLVHRDLKPDNVFLRPNGTPVLVDFGLAASFGGARGRDVLEVGGRVIGSPGYMSPEQIRGDIVDARADLYALGCILFELLTGRLPFMGSVNRMLQQHVHTPAPTPSSVVTDLSDRYDDLIQRLLAKRPQDRFGYADDVERLLRELADDADAEANAAASKIVIDWPSSRAYLYRPGLAGRQQVFDELAPLVASASEQRGGLLLISGESGVGKTRLAMEVATRAARMQLRVLTATCETNVTEDGSHNRVGASPLLGFRPVLTAAVDRCVKHGAAETEALLAGRGLLASIEPAISDLVDDDAVADLGDMDAQVARDRLLASMRELLNAYVSREPTVLVIDDIQWADEHTATLLERLAADEPVPGLLVICTYRSDEDSAQLQALAEGPGVHAVALERLDASAINNIVADMLALSSPPARLCGFLERVTEGNPFFVAEYLRAAVERSLLKRDEGGRWVVAAERQLALEDDDLEAALPPPESLRGLVEERIRALSASARELLHVAAAIGREAPASLLQRVHDVDEDAHLEALLELTQRHVLETVGVDFRFVHDKLREAAYGALPAARRVELHRSIARLLGDDPDRQTDPSRHASALAHHCLRGELWAEAIGHLERAGDAALIAGAPSDARTAFERALSVVEEQSLSVDAHRIGGWERRLAEACYSLGLLGVSSKHAHRGLDLVRSNNRRGTSTRPASSWRQRLRDRLPDLAVADVAGVGVSVTRQLTLLQRQPKPVTDPRERMQAFELARLNELLAQILYFENEQTKSFRHALDAANAAAKLGPSPELARAFGSLSVAFGFAPGQPLVATYRARAREAAERSGDTSALSWVCFTEGLSGFGMGEFMKARASLDECLQLGRRLQHWRRIEEALAILSNISLIQGRPLQSLDEIAQLEDVVRHSGDKQADVWSLTGRAECATLMGRGEEAIVFFESVRDRVDSAPDKSQRINFGLIAEAYWQTGEKESALRETDVLLDRIGDSSPASAFCIHGYRAGAEVAFAAWKERGDRSHEARAKRALEAVRRYASVFPIGEPIHLRYDAMWHAARGNVKKAERQLRTADATAGRYGMASDQARALIDWGNLLDGSDGQRNVLLSRARTLAEQAGAAHVVTAAEQALAEASKAQ